MRGIAFEATPKRKKNTDDNNDAPQEALFGDDSGAPGLKAAEKRLRLDIDSDVKKGKGRSRDGVSKKRSLEDLGGKEAEVGVEAFQPAPVDDDGQDVAKDAAPTEGVGFYAKENKEGKSAKHKTSKKDKKSKKKSKGKKSKKDKKKKKKSTSSSSESSSSSSSSSSVFRVGKTGSDRISQARLIQWAEDHPGMTALDLLRRMKKQVGEDGEKLEKTTSAPAVAKQYDHRVLKHIVGPNGYNVRNQREMTTLCVMLDHLALGRYQRAADVAAARLKSVERANREGHFGHAQFLELIEVNPEGLTSVDENLLVRNEATQNQKSWPSSDGGWQSSGWGSNSDYQWITQPQGKGKGADKGKKGEKGKKGGQKGEKGKKGKGKKESE